MQKIVPTLMTLPVVLAIALWLNYVKVPDDGVMIRVTYPTSNIDVMHDMEQHLKKHGSHANWVRSKKSGNELIMTLAPIDDPNAFAEKLSMGTITRIDGNVIHMNAE